MANIFLDKDNYDVETALMLEKARIHDIGEAVAYTDGDQVFINTNDNLNNLLPNYNPKMLKWLLWHERFHNELRHPARFNTYKTTTSPTAITHDEVNIIMDILVHDSLSKMFPELVEVAISNLAQMRNRNSLMYTFKTYTLEEMLDEYAQFKQEGPGRNEKTKNKKAKDDDKPSAPTKSKDTKKSKDTEESKGQVNSKPLQDEHDKTDWSKLDNIDSKEFITEAKSMEINQAINRLKHTKIKMAKLTETLNGLVTPTRHRTYAKPCTIKVSNGVVLKGSTPGRAQLYLCFDASGSMYREMDAFKEIISNSIPQAMETPCEWFAGTTRENKIAPYKDDDYYKAKFKDFMNIHASSGYNDDGDRTVELCWQAEQLGYSPIGITDGGGGLDWSENKLKQLKRTVFVGQSPLWLAKIKEINPRIQTLVI